MLDQTKAVAETRVAEKVYYVIKVGLSSYLKVNESAPVNWRIDYFNKKLSDAKTFVCVSALLTFIQIQVKELNSALAKRNIGPVHLSDGFTILRITEVPGSRTVRLVATTQIDATKPVVLQSPNRAAYAKQHFDNSFSDSGLAEATVFPNLNAAITANGRAIVAGGARHVYDVDAVEVRQVEIVTLPPTITETILA